MIGTDSTDDRSAPPPSTRRRADRGTAFGDQAALPRHVCGGTGLPRPGPPRRQPLAPPRRLRCRTGDVLVVDPVRGLEHGYWGEILAEAAMARGLAGLVINGGVRDSQRLVEMGWPVFAERVCIQGTGKDPHGDGELGDPSNRRCDRQARGPHRRRRRRSCQHPRSRRRQCPKESRERDRAESEYIERLRAGETTLAIYRLR